MYNMLYINLLYFIFISISKFTYKFKNYLFSYIEKIMWLYLRHVHSSNYFNLHNIRFFVWVHVWSASKAGKKAKTESKGPQFTLVEYIRVLSTINPIPDLSWASEGRRRPYVFIGCGFIRQHMSVYVHFWSHHDRR